MSIKETQLDIMQRRLKQHRAHESRGLLLLKLGFVLTFLLYLLFNQHLYLGDALSWSAYFKDSASIFGFTFTVFIVVLMALFLSWVKHHAYLHFGFFGSVALVVSTVIGFALFAEFFSSSANQDVKANVLLERNSAYQATLSTTPYSDSDVNYELITSIANAEQKLARCEANLKLGKERHCDGDRAKVLALRNSERSTQQANAEVSIQRDKLKYERQDELKAQSYNPVILTLAKALAGKAGDYKDYLKTAIVIITLFVAVCFEILHHFLSKTQGASIRAIEDLELAIAKYSVHADFSNAPASLQTTTSVKQPIGFAIPEVTPLSNQAEIKPILFKYQTTPITISETRASFPMGFAITKAETRTPPITTSPPTSSPDFGQFKARRDIFASSAFSEAEPIAPPLANRPKPVQVQLPEEIINKPLANRSEGLFGEWVAAVKAGECLPSVKPTWIWIQKRISNKETGSRTHDRTRISTMQKAFFARAIREGLMLENVNYKNGGKKYLWIA